MSFEAAPGARLLDATVDPPKSPGWLRQEDIAYVAAEFRRTGFRGCHILEGAGHWIQRERAQTVNELLLTFLKGL